jgi:hypothetical protein
MSPARDAARVWTAPMIQVWACVWKGQNLNGRLEGRIHVHHGAILASISQPAQTCRSKAANARVTVNFKSAGKKGTQSCLVVRVLSGILFSHGYLSLNIFVLAKLTCPQPTMLGSICCVRKLLMSWHPLSCFPAVMSFLYCGSTTCLAYVDGATPNLRIHAPTFSNMVCYEVTSCRPESSWRSTAATMKEVPPAADNQYQQSLTPLVHKYIPCSLNMSGASCRDPFHVSKITSSIHSSSKNAPLCRMLVLSTCSMWLIIKSGLSRKLII